MRFERGFTLIEMMVTVAIIAILASIAYPAYTDYVMKARRTDARNALLTAMGAFERYFTENARYTTAAGNATCPAAIFSATSTENHYSVSAVCTDTTFTLTAQPQGVQTGDRCGSLTINQAQVKGVSGGSLTAGQCW